jgi:hypothetical protein
MLIRLLQMIIMMGQFAEPPRNFFKGQTFIKVRWSKLLSSLYTKSKKKLPSKLRKLVEAWVEVHEQHLLEQWAKAQNKDNISIVG